MVVIRLARVGKKNSPAYRVVVAEKQRAVKRKFIEVIGHYNPILKPKTIEIDKDRTIFWMDRGAQPSNTVRNLMADLGILKKSDKINIKFARDKKKKELKAEKAETAPTSNPVGVPTDNIGKDQPKVDVKPNEDSTEDPKGSSSTLTEKKTDDAKKDLKPSADNKPETKKAPETK